MTRFLDQMRAAGARRRPFLHFVALCAGIFLTACPSPAVAQTPAWLTGPALDRQLAAPIGVHWTARSLREGLAGLGGSLAGGQRLAIVLDRRVDPDQLVDFHVSQQSLSEAFQQLAEQLELGVARLGSVLYIGPLPSARRLRTLAALRTQELRPLSTAVQARMLRSETSQWPQLATPREILQNMVAEAGGLRIGVERIGHDLWPSGELPPLPLVERLTLIANQFDLTFRVTPDGKTLELIPIVEPVRLVKSYTVRGDVAPIAVKLRELVPEAQIDIDGVSLVVAGREEDHESIRGLLAGRNSPPPNRAATSPAPRGGETRYTLTVQNETLARVLTEFETRLGLTFEWAMTDKNQREAVLRQLVSFDVRQASLDELLTAVLAPTGLAFDRENNAVSIRQETADASP